MARTARKQQHYAALPPQAKVRPAFTVERLSGTVPHRVHIFDKETNRIKSKIVQEPAGFLVKFYKGHSIRCRDEDHLRRVGAGLSLIPLLDDEGETKGVMPNIDLAPEIEEDELEPTE
jgi:hypothetical protein